MRGPTKNFDREMPTEVENTFDDIEQLAEEIISKVSGGIGTITLPSMLERVRSLKQEDLGMRRINATIKEIRLHAFLPSEVLEALNRKFSNKPIRFSLEDEQFLRENAWKGYEWLAHKFYVNRRIIVQKASAMKLEVNKGLHYFTEEEEKFIQNHLNHSWPWIAKQLNVDVQAVRYHGLKRMGVKSDQYRNRHSYTPEEDEIIRQNYERGSKWLAQQLGVSQYSINGRATRLGIRIPGRFNGKPVYRYTKKEDQILIKHYNKGAKWIHDNLRINRSVSSISSRIVLLGLRSPVYWTKSQDSIIKNNTSRGTKWISNTVGRSQNAVRVRAKKLGVKITVIRNNRPCFTWDDRKDHFFRQNLHEGSTWLANYFGVSKSCILKRAKNLGVKIRVVHSYDYTPEDDKFIKENAEKGKKWIAEQLGRTPRSIKERSKILGVGLSHFRGEEKVRYYTPEEDIFIKEHCGEGSLWIGKRLGRGSSSIQTRARKMKVSLGKVSHKFTEEDKQFIRDNADKGIIWLSEHMIPSRNSIVYFARKNNIKIQAFRKGKILRQYTKEEDELIKDNAHRGSSWLADHIKGRSRKSIEGRAKILGVHIFNPVHGRVFSKEEDDFIREKSNMGRQWLARELKAKPETISRRARKIGVEITPYKSENKPLRKFTETEENFIRENCDKTAFWIAKHLNRKTNTVREKIGKMGIKTKPVKFCFTTEEDRFILENKDKGSVFISKQIGRSRRSIWSRAKRLGVSISDPRNKRCKLKT